MRFEFASASRIIFGPGTRREVAAQAAELGTRALVVTGSASERALPLIERLAARGIEAISFAVSGEPTTETAMAGVRAAREGACNLVIAMGGGSVLDAGKAISTLLTNEGDLLDYLEVIGRGRALTRPALPCIAVPTTAGTGSEVTRNAVLSSPMHRVKVSLRSPLMLPRLAVVDPELTHSMPPSVTASTGLDALTQLVEPFTGNSPNPLTDGLCREGLQRVARSLRRTYEDGHDAGAREEMAIASLFGGLALANSKLGAVHGLAGPLGGMFPAPHGAICARLLPLVMETNVRALRTRAPDSPALARYGETARTLTGKSTASATDGIAWVRELCSDLAIPPLATHGVEEGDVREVVAQAQRASSMKGNPIALTAEELTELVREAI